MSKKSGGMSKKSGGMSKKSVGMSKKSGGCQKKAGGGQKKASPKLIFQATSMALVVVLVGLPTISHNHQQFRDDRAGGISNPGDQQILKV